MCHLAEFKANFDDKRFLTYVILTLVPNLV